MRKKILVIVNDIRRAQEHEWFVSLINHNLFEIEFALINSKGTIMDNFLSSNKIVTWHYNYHSKIDLPGLTYSLFNRMRKGRYDIIHTHLFISSLAGLLAGLLARIPRRIMTRHHPDFHHVYFPSAVKYDRFMNYLSTDIVAISRNVKNVLVDMENVNPEKVTLIHHGIDLTAYETGAVSEDRILEVRRKYSLKGDLPVVGAISRFTEWKGLQFLIKSFVKLLNDIPDAILVLANATGDFTNRINEMLLEIPEKNKRVIKFENDIAALYRVFDCFVHIPVSITAEAFGQTYIESLASKVPSIFTLRGVAAEFAVDNQNCFIVPYRDAEAVYEKLKFTLNNIHSLESITNEGYRIVKEKFDIMTKINKLEKLYLHT